MAISSVESLISIIVNKNCSYTYICNLDIHLHMHTHVHAYTHTFTHTGMLIHVIRDIFGKQVLFKWWHGTGGLLDYTNEEAVQWWLDQVSGHCLDISLLFWLHYITVVKMKWYDIVTKIICTPSDSSTPASHCAHTF